jgi:hypothetical protein
LRGGRLKKLREENSDLLGKTVIHPTLGEGEIVDVKWKGTYVRIRFGKFSLWIPTHHLRIKRKIRKTKKVKEKKYKELGDGIKPKRMIEAFRYGIVPHPDIEDFTFGRDSEIEEIKSGEREFEKNGGYSVLVEGEYGAGKTHFLDYLFLYFVKRDYLVAKVEIDPFDVSLSKPWRVYREITRSMEYKGGGFREFLREALRDGLDPPHIFLSILERKLKRGQDSEFLWLWIEGERNPRIYLDREVKGRTLPVLLTHSTAANIYTYLLSAYGHLTKKIGLKGFVILMDEVETCFHIWFDYYMGINFLKALILSTKNLKELTTLNGNKQLVSSGVRRTPFIYRIPSNLFLILASTPVYSRGYHEIIDLVDNLIPLEPLMREDFEEMFDALISIYEKAYPHIEIREKERIFKFVMREREKGVRYFIKATIEALDLVRHYPDVSVNNLLNYAR